MNESDERLLKVLGLCANLKARVNTLTAVCGFLFGKMGGDSKALLEEIERISREANESDLLAIGESDPEAAEILDILNTLKKEREKE